MAENTTTKGQAPSALEIQRKLSSTQRKGKARSSLSPGPALAYSGTDTEDEGPHFSPPEATSIPPPPPTGVGLQVIAEKPTSGADDSEDEDEGVWRVAKGGHAINKADSSVTVLHTGYLWKKNSSGRKSWKKRWFVLRPTHLAYYKSSAEYALLRLLDLSEIHAVTPVHLKRHPNSCGIVTRSRTFYFQAETEAELEKWVIRLNEAREALNQNNEAADPDNASASLNASSSPVPPVTVSLSQPTPPAPVPATEHKSPPKVSIVFTDIPPSASVSPVSPSHQGPGITSSDSEDGVPTKAGPSKGGEERADSSKVLVSGYLMKCGSKRKNWRKRWFILTATRMVYMGSHMDTKPHRQILLSQILDAMEYNKDGSRGVNATSGPSSSTHPAGYISDEEGFNGAKFTFKVITTKKTLLLCAPSEEEEVKWISAIRVLIARRKALSGEVGTAKDNGSIVGRNTSTAGRTVLDP